MRRLKVNTIFLVIITGLCSMISIGYSALSQAVTVGGDASYNSGYLYSVFEKPSNSNYVHEYTGTHQDSMAGVGSSKIYHWYANNNTDGTTILDRNNVIFGNYCWQMIRTTDTGGVKMIYNGKAADGKCLDNRDDSIGYVDYVSVDLSTNYYYGTNFEYNPQTNKFNISGTTSTGQIKEKEYTCLETSSSATCDTLYYIAKNVESTYYALTIDDNSPYSQIGTVPFNDSNEYLSSVGYMNNARYETGERTIPLGTITVSVKQSGIINKYYGDSIIWNTNTNKYELVNPFKITSVADYALIVGKYTFNSSEENYSSNTVRYITNVGYMGGLMSYLYLTLGSGNDYDYYLVNNTYGDGLIDNNNGTFTLTNAQTINTLNYYDNYTNLVGKYLCRNSSSATCSTPIFVISSNYFSFRAVSAIYKFSNSFSYSNNQYTLNSATSMNIVGSQGIETRHYTCFNGTGICDKIYYIISFVNECNNNSSCYFYMQLSNGESIDDAYNNMNENDNINLNDSIIKIALEEWYRRELNSYSNYIEDVIYCNNRFPSNKETSGWNPNGGSVDRYIGGELLFSESNFYCRRLIDSFSTNNIKAKTKYPVGLISFQEADALYNVILRKTDNFYWTMTPYSYNWNGGKYLTALSQFIRPEGTSGNSYPTFVIGLRPVISLKPNTKYISGNGSMANPYVIQTS